MTTKTIFIMDSALKKAAMKKARTQGLTLSTVLNMAVSAFVNDNLKIGAFDRELIRARLDVRYGRVIEQEALFKKLGF